MSFMFGTSLKKYLEDTLPYIDKPRSIKARHASDITNQDLEYCPRERALSLVTGKPLHSKVVGASLAHTFSLGRYLEDQIRNIWARNIAFGNWKCSHCGVVVRDRAAPQECLACGHPTPNYSEYRFICSETGISMGADLLVKLPSNPKFVLVEIKSIKHEDWLSLKTALFEHRARTILYQHIIKTSPRLISSFVDTDCSYVLYVSKGYGAKTEAGTLSPFKEYKINYQPEFITEFLQKGRDITRFIDEGLMPGRLCSKPSDYRASKCSQCKACFSGTFKQGEIYEEKKQEA
jgi:hypothetical protein